MRLPIAILLASALSGRANADRIDSFVLSELKRQHIPGAWVVVRKDGRVVKRKGYGMANLELSVPVTPETRMQTGSVGKMFTAAGIMLLVEDGKLKLSDSIATYFDHSPDWWKPITISQLLSHTGGVPEYEGDKYSVDLRKEYTEDELIQFAQSMKPDFAPGEKWSYSNTDYMILGVLIHKLSGQFYGDFLRDRLWKPNHLPTMQVISDSEIVPHRAAGYQWVDNHWVNQDWVSAALNSTADGTLYASADDFIAWDRALDSYSVMPKSLQDQMWEPARLNDGTLTYYGFGWEVDEHLGHRRLHHNGAWQGFMSSYIRFPDDHLSVAVFENCAGTDPDKIGMGIAERLDRSLDAHSLKPIAEDPDELAAVKHLMSDIFSGTQPTARVSGIMATLPAEYLASQKARTPSFGALKAFEPVFRKSGTSVYRISFEKKVLWIKFIQDSLGRFVKIESV